MNLGKNGHTENKLLSVINSLQLEQFNGKSLSADDVYRWLNRIVEMLEKEKPEVFRNAERYQHLLGTGKERRIKLDRQTETARQILLYCSIIQLRDDAGRGYVEEGITPLFIASGVIVGAMAMSLASNKGDIMDLILEYLPKGVQMGVEKGMEKPTKEIREVLHRHTSPEEELSRIDQLKKAYDRLGTWAKVAADIIGKIDHERKQGKPNPNGNAYLSQKAYKRLVEDLKTKTPKSLVKEWADTLSKTVRRFDINQKTGKTP